MKDTNNRLLIVDDEVAIRDFFATVAEKLGFEVYATDNVDAFRDIVLEVAPTVIVLDLNMPSHDGIELMRILAEEKSSAKILLISGQDFRVLRAVERLGLSQGLQMAGTIQKPVMLTHLQETLTELMSRTITESDLAAAIASGDLVVHYQPKLTRIDDGDWRVSGAEALVRWNHAKYGMLMPDEFIQMAEETGLIAPLTDFVLKKSMEQNAIWADKGLILNIAVNISPRFLTDVEFPDKLAVLQQKYGVDSSRLTLEITETAAMTNLEVTMDILTRLRLKGVELSIDDFGTGYSSLKQLFCMPFSELKIDRSFVREISTSSDAQTIVKAMIQLAHNLNMTACAEGVENEEALAFLGSVGCDAFQGFLISEPISALKFEYLVSNWSNVGQQMLLTEIA